MDERERVERVRRILVEKTADLDGDEREACAKLWRAVARRRRIEGRPESWAAGVYYTYCRMVFREGFSRSNVENLFKVPQATFTRKSTEIQRLLNLKIYDKRFTPARIYEGSPMAEFEKAFRQTCELEAIEGFFEVKEKGEDGVTVVDLQDGREYFVRERTALPKLRVGQVLSTTIFPRGEAYAFPGVIEVLDPEDEKQRLFIDSIKDYYSGRYRERAIEIQRELCQASMEYFGRTDPVLKSAVEAEKALDDFMVWFSQERKLSDKGKSPSELWMEEHGETPKMPRMRFPRELRNVREDIGLIFDEIGGIYILPHYGSVKKALQGKLEEVPNHKNLIRSLVFQEGFIPPFLLERLIKESPEQAVKAFATTFKKIKTTQDILNMLKKHRPDWDEKPKPSVIPIRY